MEERYTLPIKSILNHKTSLQAVISSHECFAAGTVLDWQPQSKPRRRNWGFECAFWYWRGWICSGWLRWRWPYTARLCIWDVAVQLCSVSQQADGDQGFSRWELVCELVGSVRSSKDWALSGPGKPWWEPGTGRGWCVRCWPRAPGLLWQFGSPRDLLQQSHYAQGLETAFLSHLVIDLDPCSHFDPDPNPNPVQTGMSVKSEYFWSRAILFLSFISFSFLFLEKHFCVLKLKTLDANHWWISSVPRVTTASVPAPSQYH